MVPLKAPGAHNGEWPYERNGFAEKVTFVARRL